MWQERSIASFSIYSCKISKNSLSLRSTLSCHIDVYGLQDSTRQIAPKYIERAKDYIHQHLHSSFTLYEIAQAVGVSVRTLSGGFRKYCQMTAAQYIRDLRLKRVRKELLKAHPNQTVTDIALGCGYVNLGDFARLYRQQYGERPSDTLKRVHMSMK